MKRIGLFIMFLSVFWLCNSQNHESDRQIIIGVFSEIGKNQPVRLTRKYVTEDVGPFHGKESWALGLKLSGKISQKLRLEIGAGYSQHDGGFELSPPINPVSKIYPETIRTYFIPINIYWYFVKDLYLDFGTMADFESPGESYWIDSQNGIGFSFGAGKEFRVNRLVINISPDLELHSVIPFHSVQNQQRLFVFGIKLGIGPCFRKREKENINTEVNHNDSALL